MIKERKWVWFIQEVIVDILDYKGKFSLACSFITPQLLFGK